VRGDKIMNSSKIIGVVIAIILLIAVGIQVTVDVTQSVSSNVSAVTQTLLNLLPLAMAVVALVIVFGLSRGK
jgi:mannose/fructose/N-acetylgalactosamine-specific phosphotransferase system component IID